MQINPVCLLKALGLILALACFCNIASFAMAKVMLGREHFQSCDLVTLREAAPGDVVNICVCGLYNNPEPAFDFLMNDLPGGIMVAKFRHTGWSAKETAKQILTHVTYDSVHNKYRIITISVGDHVARYLEESLAEYPDVQFEVIAINPCPYFVTLNMKAMAVAIYATPLAQVGCFLLGWLSIQPMSFMSAPGGNYSLALLTDQGREIMRSNVPDSTEHTVAIIVSENDQFLDNVIVKDFFEGAHVAMIPEATHADTAGNAAAYRDAMKAALLFSKF